MTSGFKNIRLLIVSILIIVFSGCSTSPDKSSKISIDEQREFATLSRIDPIPPTINLIKNDKYAEANEYLSYFLELDYVKDDFDANSLFKRIESKRSEWKYQVSKAIDGCLEGKSDEIGGLTAASVCDTLIIGDVRDLWEQGNNYLQGQDIDKMSLALASMSVGATGATVATLGASNAIKPALSFLKLSNKTGKTPDWLPAYFQSLLNNPKKPQAASEFSSFMEELWKLIQNAGPKATLELLSKSKSVDDFHKLAGLGARFGSKTSTLIKLGGDEVISLAQRNKEIPNQLYYEASSYGKNGINALNKNGAQKFRNFVDAENGVRRRMTEFEMNLIASGKRVTVLGNEFVKKDYQFNPKFVDGAGRSNLERMKTGLAPIGNDGNPINLHHMKQQKNGVLVEITATDHREYSELLHRYSRVSEIDRDEFNLLKNAYWKLRAKDFEK